MIEQGPSASCTKVTRGATADQQHTKRRNKMIANVKERTNGEKAPEAELDLGIEETMDEVSPEME